MAGTEARPAARALTAVFTERSAEAADTLGIESVEGMGADIPGSGGGRDRFGGGGGAFDRTGGATEGVAGTGVDAAVGAGTAEVVGTSEESSTG
mmetsp:Transcript_44672/g.83278  ORF Transcript_44672/g.83278 Transcript_44672/m.83278 type:complete len:94 (-) Transcript_44672:273-554(-)